MSETRIPVKLRFFDLKDTFARRLADGKIDNGDICFVKDTGEIYVFDGVFGGVNGGLGPGFDVEEQIGYVSRIAQTDGLIDVDVVQSIPASDISIDLTEYGLNTTTVEDAIKNLAASYEWEEF